MSDQDSNAVSAKPKPDDGSGLGWDLDALRLDSTNAAQAGAKKLITTIPVRKPDKQSFVRVRGDENWMIDTAVIDLKEEREVYLVAPDLVKDVSSEWSAVTLFYSITRQGDVFLWPIKLPMYGRTNPWNESALVAVEEAKKSWVRVVANQSLGAYDVFAATGNLPEPEWPELTFKEALGIAFRGRVVDHAEHAVLKRLRGAL